MTSENIKRILIYTHNSIGLGHAFRTLAVVTGIKKWRPDIDFLVISGTSIPQIFFREGIELIKLPSIGLNIDHKDSPMYSRYLSGFDLPDIFDFRQKIITESFAFFQPDVLMVEHNMTGQMSELIPLLMKKWMRKGGPMDFCLVHLCRGIMRWVPILEIPYQNPRHRSESIDIGALYDLMYVLEDREVIDINRAFLGNDPELGKKIRYLGKITNKVYGELPTRAETLQQFNLSDREIILISLGRNSRVPELATSLLSGLAQRGITSSHQVVVSVDPYLNGTASRDLRDDPVSEGVRFLPFVPNLVDLVHHAELVITRAGYNMVNEILLTGTKAILIPEGHGGGEQELRAQNIHEDRVCVLTEDEVLTGDPTDVLAQMLTSEVPRVAHRFDKYAIGKIIVEDLERWKTGSRRDPESKIR
jgi:predicted glycosyltransferase